MERDKVTPDLVVAEVMERWPETLVVFLSHRMSCVGCYLSRFDTLGDALRVYHLPVAAIVASMNQHIVESLDGA